MVNLKLIPFKAEHLAIFIHRDSDYMESVQNMLDKERRGPAFTAVCDDMIVGCAGVIIQWPGVGVAWAVFSQNIFKYPIWVTRNVRVALRDFIRAYQLHRVEMVVLPQHVRWAEALGFSRENGLARCYTVAQQDVIRYELVEKR
jgi:hypothetical protein